MMENLLGRLEDLEQLIPLLIEIPKSKEKAPESRLKGVILLKHSLELVEPIKSALSKYSSTILSATIENIEEDNFQAISNLIDKYVNSETQYQKGCLNQRTQMCFALKPGLNGMLDVSRKTYTEIVEDIQDLVRQLSIEHSLPLKINFNGTRGFFIQMFDPMHGKSSESKKLPEIFLKITKQRGNYSFTTEELLRLNGRLTETLHEIFVLSSNVLEELVLEISKYLDCIYKFVDAISLVDLLFSLANYRISTENTVCPEFTDTLAIKDCHHPAILKNRESLANDVFSSPTQYINLITGSNMSGKSTYLKMICWIQIMAQVGSFLPCSYASIRLYDSLFTRINHNDSIEQNLSTFQLEMSEIDYIIKSANDQSLIVVDELARGTSLNEAQAICIATLEHFMVTKSTCFFVTHFFGLLELETYYPCMANWHFISPDSKNAKEINHEIAKGKLKREKYGLEIAGKVSLPKQILDKAKIISLEFEKNLKKSRPDPAQSRKVIQHKLYSRLRQCLINSKLDFEDHKALLIKLQDEIRDFLEIDREN